MIKIQLYERYLRGTESKLMAEKKFKLEKQIPRKNPGYDTKTNY
jgi:hypothetical protein